MADVVVAGAVGVDNVIGLSDDGRSLQCLGREMSALWLSHRLGALCPVPFFAPQV